MAKYVYPAVFTPEDGGYAVDFPDLEGCYTCGDDLADAMFMAADVLALTLWGLEKEKAPIPEPSRIENVTIESEEFVSYITVDTTEYSKKVDTKAVKRTVSLPHWLDVIATENGVNFSQVLQTALKEKLNVAR